MLGNNLDFNESFIKRYGKNLYILGTAETGELYKPILIKDINHLHNVFGYAGSLIDGYISIFNLGYDINIYCVKATGAQHVCHINIDTGYEILKNAFTLTTKTSNDLNGSISVEIAADGLIINYPQGLDYETKVYPFFLYKTLFNLVTEINRDCSNGIGCVYASTDISENVDLFTSIFPVNKHILFMERGYSGLNVSKNEYYYSLDECLNVLQGSEVNVIIPLKAYIDDYNRPHTYGKAQYGESSYTNRTDYLTLSSNGKPLIYQDLLINFCKVQKMAGILTHAVMGFNPIEIDNNSLKEFDNNYIIQLVDNSTIGNNSPWNDKISYESLDNTFLSVYVGDIVYYNYNIDNGYLMYGALLANNHIYESLTNKELPSDIQIATSIDTDTIYELFKRGVVTSRVSPLKGNVLASCITRYTGDNEDFKFIYNCRSLQLVSAFANAILDKHIGEPYKYIKDSNIINEEMSSLFDKLKEYNILSIKSDYEILYDDSLYNASINYNIGTEYMVENISTSSKEMF